MTEFFCNFAVCKKAKDIYKTRMINKTPLYLLLAMAVTLMSLPALVSCNHKDDDDDSVYSYSTSEQTTLVTSFALQADANVLTSLDSVHFTVDYDKGLIYNADSLPVGTDITALKVTVNFLNSVSSATFTITGATEQADTTIEYTSSMTKSIDFTGKTVLKVTSSDKEHSKEYDVKVLVHKQNPDSMIWSKSWRRNLPGYRNSAIGHKAVEQGDIYRIMVYNGVECIMWSASAINQENWENHWVSLPFTPRVPTLTATADALYILADDGMLYTSPDGTEWTSCGVTWYSLLGSYDGHVLGIMKDADGQYYHDEYPRSDGFSVSVVEEDFPVSNTSDLIEADNTWTLSQQAMLLGGVDRQGRMLGNVWGYDGTTWGKINSIHSQVLPAIADATLFSYYTYRTLSGVRRYARQQTWFVMGGKLADGTLNDKVYLSRNQGVTWVVGDSTMAQPSYMHKFYGAQAFVNFETLSATGASYLPRRVQSAVTTWECPFVYLLGGYDEQGALLPFMWRGVYNRMTNYPVY